MISTPSYLDHADHDLYGRVTYELMARLLAKSADDPDHSKEHGSICK